MRRKLTAARADQAIRDLIRAPVARVPHGPLVDRCWELRENVTPYDAVYVALAERLGVPLVTADRRLTASPGPRCTFELMT